MWVCRFSQPPKVPASWNFDSRCHLGQLKTRRSPIFEFFIDTNSRIFCGVFLRILILTIINFVHNFLSPKTHCFMKFWLQAHLKENEIPFLTFSFLQILGAFFVCAFINKSQNHVFVHNFLSHHSYLKCLI